MDHIPDEDLAEVSKASHEVVQEAKGAGVWIFGGGLRRQQATIVGSDGSVTDGPVPETKAVVRRLRGHRGLVARRGPGPCGAYRPERRCAEEVREIMYDQES